jgi:phage-related protein
METTKRDLEQEVIERVKAELNPVDTDELYDQMLDECYEPFMGQYAPSRVLAEVDPTAYRCGKCDYIDSISRDNCYEEIDEELYDAGEVKEIREEIEAEIDAEEAEAEEDDDE